LDLGYENRSELVASGWDFLARTAGGAARNTERTSGAVVSYDASGLQVPADVGDLWEGLNDTRNSLFRDLSPSWTSVRARLSFAPTQNYQQAGLVVYGNDDNYVHVARAFNSWSGGQQMVFARETGANASVPGQAAVTASSNLWLRLDRDAGTGAITAHYSTNGGSTWQQLGGSVTQTISNPRLGLIVGASPSGTPVATLHEVEIHTPVTGVPMSAMAAPSEESPEGDSGAAASTAPSPQSGPAPEGAEDTSPAPRSGASPQPAADEAPPSGAAPAPAADPSPSPTVEPTPAPTGSEESPSPSAVPEAQATPREPEAVDGG
jgi:regulation of enolase protein 1 (concanavalin A-like superfamily)